MATTTAASPPGCLSFVEGAQDEGETSSQDPRVQQLWRWALWTSPPYCCSALRALELEKEYWQERGGRPHSGNCWKRGSRTARSWQSASGTWWTNSSMMTPHLGVGRTSGNDPDVMREAIGAVLSDADDPTAEAFRRQCGQLVWRCIKTADRIQQVSDVVNMV